MTTGIHWGKGHHDELVGFETGLNGANAEELARLACQARQPGADFMDVYFDVLYHISPPERVAVISAHWFGRHPDPAQDKLPMWASNAVLSPEQVHALMKETMARIALWLAGDVGNREIQLWCRCSEPELQTWIYTPTTADPSAPAVGHVFIATPYNAAYPLADHQPGAVHQQAAANLLAAIDALTKLGPGASVADILAAADQATAARALLPGANSVDDNGIFGAICRDLPPATGYGAVFRGTGLAGQMTGQEADVSQVEAIRSQNTRGPMLTYFQPADYDAQWTERVYDVEHLRYQLPG
jgi:hypothetical protein